VKRKPCQNCLGTGDEQNQNVRGGQARHYRVVAKLTLAQVGKRMGISAQFLNDLEHGNRKWTYDRWNAMLKACGLK
jgi:transcriptional regulator with XRE-family HTH domain